MRIRRSTLVLYITVTDRHVKRRRLAACLRLCFYLLWETSFVHVPNSPWTWPQSRMLVVYFLVASKVAGYKAVNDAVSLGNTLLWRFSSRYVEFSDSIAFFVLIAFLTVVKNLKIGETTSLLSFQRFLDFGYSGLHFSVTRSKAARASCSTVD